jgi:hypothetical protein
MAQRLQGAGTVIVSESERAGDASTSQSGVGRPPQGDDNSHPADDRGLQGVLAISGFRRLWLGQIFSQLADKFYIVLMVFVIARYWVSTTPPEGGALAEAAAAISLDLESRAQVITSRAQ